ncbi:MAG: cysteine desulfurase family protein [Candidatus Nanoarchaeia archaeon]|nr:cysteine desulfurase family protein [Candidatus Nanoarchaeia archaeon]MDD5357766.1 cysteine desulfurase family protein [Candidatus Nanoarchaeia archaeon]MDD5588685.1 cysteine desulfurase family protein [Candidatus Nanoarchaeia archaeon]
MKTIYLDNAATTRVDDDVLKEMIPYFTEKYGNASSMHFKGQEAKFAMEKARKIIAKEIGAKPEEIIFTSGGTEANNLTLKGLFFWNKENETGRNHIITTRIEHDCILNTCKWLERQGAKITYLDVDAEGFINLNELEDSITDKTIVVSVIHGNNEIGVIQDLESIGKICRAKNVLFHTDACQSFTKTFLDVRRQNLDFVTLNAHKIHGPKGVGALYIREGIKITPTMHGGGHERKIRSGTENVSGIVGFGKAVEIAKKKDVEKMIRLRDKIIDGILRIPNTRLNGSREKRLCNNVNISFNNIEGESIGGYLETFGICTSTGSACASHSLETSHVLKAIGLLPVQANSTLRISISKYTTEEEVNYLLEKLVPVVEKLRKMSPIK